MLKNNKSSYLQHQLLFIVILLGFIISKLTHLHVPYFWDESWVYAPAVNTMAELGPTLNPSSFPLEHSRGHPLLFHFLGGIWIKIFGNSLYSLHAFALSISTVFICIIYFYLRKSISVELAIVSIVLLVFQPIFYAQASMVLPEILLALLGFLSLVFLYHNHWIAYIITGSLAIWTKESALAFILCLFCARLIVMIKHKEFSASELLLTAVPMLSFVLFLLINKLSFDFYLYPEHTGMVSLEPRVVLGKLKAIFENVFIDQKRFGLSLISLIACSYLAGKKSKLFEEDFLIYLLVPIIGYSVFSSINFYTVRYILTIFPLVIILMTWILVSALSDRKIWLLSVILAITTHTVIQLFDRRSIADINLSYLDYGPVQLETVQYFEDNNLYDSPIQTGFLPSTGLTNIHAGYRSTKEQFTSVNTEMSDGDNYFIFSSVEPHHLKDTVINNPKSKKIKHIRRGNVEFEIYLLRGKL